MYCNMFFSSKTLETDFVIDLHDIWNCLGLKTKEESKEFLIKNFNNNDYKIISNEQILLTTNSFKKLYYKTRSIDNEELQNYYKKLKQILDDICLYDKYFNNENFENNLFTLLMLRK